MEQFHLLSAYGSVEGLKLPRSKRASFRFSMLDTLLIWRNMWILQHLRSLHSHKKWHHALLPPCKGMKKTNASNWLWSFAANSGAVNLMRESSIHQQVHHLGYTGGWNLTPRYWCLRTAFQPKGIKLSIRPQVRIADLFFNVAWTKLCTFFSLFPQVF